MTQHRNVHASEPKNFAESTDPVPKLAGTPSMQWVVMSEERLRMAMDAAKIGTFDWNMHTGEIYWSSNLESLMGLAAGGFEGNVEAFERYVHPEDLDRVQRSISHAAQTGEAYEAEFRMVRPSGNVRWVQARAKVLFDDTGRAARMIGIDIDITERKKVEEELLRSQKEAKAQAENLAAILDAVPVMTFIAHDPECKQMTSSRVAYEMLRLPRGANTSKSAPPERDLNPFQVIRGGKVLSPEELPVQRAAATGETVRDAEVRIAFDDGTWLDILGHAAPLLDERGQVRGAVGAFVDITERKRADEEAKKNEARYRRFIDANLVGIVSSRYHGGFFEANDIFLRMLGYSREEFLGGNLSWIDLTPPEFHARGVEAVEELKATGVFAPFEKEFFRKDGTRVPVLIGAAAISQSPLEWMCFVLDLTERKRIDELKTRERIQRELLEHEILAREEERRILARELHDESGQMLASLLAGLRLIGDAKDLDEAKSQAQNLRRLASQAMDELGQLSRGLHPLALDDLGLEVALKSYAHDYDKLHGIKVKLKIAGLDSRRLSKEIEAGVYRIVQEALTNISRHSKAKNAEILLKVVGKDLELTVADNGRGFDPERLAASPSKHHFGLQGMRERAAMLGGQFKVQSQTGGGTIKTVRIPLKFAVT